MVTVLGNSGEADLSHARANSRKRMSLAGAEEWMVGKTLLRKWLVSRNAEGLKFQVNKDFIP